VSGLRYGVHLPSFADPGALVERGVLAEANGSDGGGHLCRASGPAIAGATSAPTR
jgi:hypothetical protein